MNKVLVVGHFGKGKEWFDGQTIKTRNFVEELEKRSELIVFTVDTQNCRKHFFSFVKDIISLSRECSNIVMLPAQNGLRFLAPLFVLLCNKQRKSHYVVIGGWLPSFIRKHKILKFFIKRINYIYVETNKMKADLTSQSINNIYIMPNFKKLRLMKSDLSKKKEYRYCTFSRVMKEKGIEEAVLAIEKAREEGHNCTLDIYGKIDERYEQYFFKLIKDKEFAKYQGVINPDESTVIICKYYGVLFPTYYDGEGLAGTIIDSFCSGVPVIGTNWHYNDELIENNKTGYLVEPENYDDLAQKIMLSIKDNELWQSMQDNCLDKARMFIGENAIGAFVSNI